MSYVAPTTVDTREALFARVKTQLEFINGRGDYTQCVRRVERGEMTPEQMGARPFMLVIETDERDENPARQTGLRQFLIASFSVFLFIDAQKAHKSSSMLNAWGADIRIALLKGANRNLNDTAHFVDYVGRDVIAPEKPGLLFCSYNFEAHYSAQWDDPTAC